MIKRYFTRQEFENQLIQAGDWPEYEVLRDTRWVVRGKKSKQSIVETAPATNVYVKYLK